MHMFHNMLFWAILILLQSKIDSYSIGVTKRTDSSNSIQFEVRVNNVATPVQTIFPDKDTFTWYDFDAEFGDKIQVKVLSATNFFEMYYIIKDGPSGAGKQIYNSMSSQFNIANECDFSSGCNVVLNSNNFIWGSTKVNVFVKGIPVVDGYNGASPASFKIEPFDSIYVQVVDSTPSDLYSLSFAISASAPSIIDWYSNSLGTNVMIPNSAPTVEFMAPEDGSAFYAGKSAPIRLFSTPASDIFKVELHCGDDQISHNIPSNTVNDVEFPIPLNIYGNPCIFTVIAPIQTIKNVVVSVGAPVHFERPTSTTIHYINDPVSVLLKSPLVDLNQPVSVIQVCGSNTTTYTNVTVGETIQVFPPWNYLGLCKFSSTPNTAFDAAFPDVSIEIVKKTIEFVLPNNGTKIPAGTDAMIALKVLPPVNAQFQVQLNCGGNMRIVRPVTSDLDDPQPFLVPSYFYGSSCTFSVIDYSSEYDLINHSRVIITHNLSIVSPQQDQIVIYPDPVKILVKSGDLPITTPVFAMLICDDNIFDIIPLITNVPYEFYYSNTIFHGNCTLLIDDAPPYLVHSDVVNFSMKTKIFFENSPKLVVVGREFDIQINTIGSIVPKHDELELSMYCDDFGLAHTWPNVRLNELDSLILNESLSSAPLKCYFVTMPSNVYTQATSYVTVFTELTPQETEHFCKTIAYSGRWTPITEKN